MNPSTTGTTVYSNNTVNNPSGGGQTTVYTPVSGPGALPTTLTSANLQPTTPATIPPTMPTTGYAGLQGMVDGYTQGLGQRADQTGQAAGDSFEALLNQLNNQQGSAQLTNTAYNENGVNTAQSDLSNVSNQILAEKNALNHQVLALKQNPNGMFGDALSQQIQRVSDASTARQADLAVIQAASQGRYDIAKQISDRQVAAQTEAQQNKINTLQAMFNANKDLFTTAEAQQFQAAQAARQQAASAAQGRYKDSITTQTDAFGNQSQAVRVFDTLTGQFVGQPGQTAAQLNSGDSGGATGGNYGTASSTIAQITGLNPDTPLSQIDPNQLLPGIVKNEGGSLPGVQNNPGNVKFAGLPGQIDSGVKAADGGTFASYATPAAGQQSIINDIKAGQKNNPNEPLGSFIGRYTNTAPKEAQKPSFEQYGLLANTDFNPNAAGQSGTIDKLAANYIDTYLKNGTVPTASTLGRNMKPGGFAAVQSRADDVYFQATGSHLPNPEVIKGYQQQLIGNNNLLNNLKVQEGTIQQNSDLLLKNLNGNNINQAAPLINGIIDNIKNSLGDPNVATYLAQNTTVSNELGSLLALKNAQGTTVHDKLEAAGLISAKDNADQIAAKVKVLMQEASNAHDAIQGASAELYKQIDPLMQDPNNPMRQQISSYRSQVPAGEILISRSGRIGHIPPNEYDPTTDKKL